MKKSQSGFDIQHKRLDSSLELNEYFDSKKQFLQGFVNDRDKLRSLLNRNKELSKDAKDYKILKDKKIEIKNIQKIKDKKVSKEKIKDFRIKENRVES